jgi:hypothetical protein
MLRRYKEIMPKLPVEDLDVLIVDEIGKEISGGGMETKIVGRLRSGAEEPKSPRIRYIITTDLTPASHGNACGIGIADFTTRRLFDKIDLAAMNENILTCRLVEQGKMPLITENDRQAVEFSLRALGKTPPDGPRMIRIKNTLRMSEVYMTKNLLDAAAKCPAVSKIGTREVPIFRDDSSDLIPFDMLGE